MKYLTKKEKKWDLAWYAIIVLIGVALAVMGHYSGAHGEDGMYNSYVESTAGEVAADEAGICPRTHIKGKVAACLTCHIKGSFAVKETDPDDMFDYPNFMTTLDKVGGEWVGRYALVGINSDTIAGFFRYMDQHNVNHVVIEIHSPGGSLLDAWRIAGMMTHWEKQKPGRIVETRVYGFAASAGFLVAISGTLGHRYVSRTAELMWHELWTFSMFKLDTPSSSEEEAKVLRHLQDTTNDWISGRCKLSKEELDEKIKNKEMWVNGLQAVEEYGFMDQVLN